MDYEQLGILGVHTKEDLIRLYKEIMETCGINPKDRGSLSKLRIIRVEDKTGNLYSDTAAFVSHKREDEESIGKSNLYENADLQKMLKGNSRSNYILKETRFFDPKNDADLADIAEICAAYNQKQLWFMEDGTFENRKLVTDSKYGMTLYNKEQIKSSGEFNVPWITQQNTDDKMEYAYMAKARTDALKTKKEKKAEKKVPKDKEKEGGIVVPEEIKAEKEAKPTANEKANYEKLDLNRQGHLGQHINEDDEIVNVSQHVMKTTSAGYGKLKTMTKEEVRNRKVHHAKGKEQTLNEEPVLEFVVAGSGASQWNKTYKGYSGRNEYAEIVKDPEDNQILNEIQSNIGRKYKVTYGSKTNQEKEFRQAMDKEYGKPMYIDETGEFHKAPGEKTRVLNGVREKVDGTRTRYNLSGPMASYPFMLEGTKNAGDYSIENLRSYMMTLARNWLDNVKKTYDPTDPNAKPIHIYMKGHSRGACAVDEASAAINALIEKEYKELRDKVHIETQMLDPVPGIDANSVHSELDHTQKNIIKQGISMRGLACNQNNDSTVFYGMHINHSVGFNPKTVKGANRIILTGKNHNMGVFDIDNGHKKGHILAENGEEYRGTGMSDLKNGLFIEDENNVLMEIKNAQEAHDLIDSMVEGLRGQSRRHAIMHEMVDNWFSLHPEEITPKDIRYNTFKELKEDQKALENLQKAVQDPDPDMRPADPKTAKYTILANMFAHEQVMNDLESVRRSKDRNKIVQAKMQLVPKTVDKLAHSPEFQAYVDGLSRNDLMLLSQPGNRLVKEHLKAFRAEQKLPVEQKEDLVYRRYEKKYFEETQRKEFFFDKYTDGKNNFINIPDTTKRMDLSVDRTALSSLAICAMLEKGYAMEDIMDPDKLQAERQLAGDEVMEAYVTKTDQELAKYCAEKYSLGIQIGIANLDAKIDSMPELTSEALSRPENRVFRQMAHFINDMGQELNAHKPIKDQAEELYGKEQIAQLLDKQYDMCTTLDFLKRGQETVDRFAHMDPTEKMLGKDFSGEMATMLSKKYMDDIVKQERAQNPNKKYSEIAKSLLNKEMMVGQMLIQSEEVTALLESLEDKKVKEGEEVLDVNRVRELANALKEGTVYNAFEITDMYTLQSTQEGKDLTPTILSYAKKGATKKNDSYVNAMDNLMQQSERNLLAVDEKLIENVRKDPQSAMMHACFAANKELETIAKDKGKDCMEYKVLALANESRTKLALGLKNGTLETETKKQVLRRIIAGEIFRLDNALNNPSMLESHSNEKNSFEKNFDQYATQLLKDTSFTEMSKKLEQQSLNQFIGANGEREIAFDAFQTMCSKNGPDKEKDAMRTIKEKLGDHFKNSFQEKPKEKAAKKEIDSPTKKRETTLAKTAP